MVVDDEATTADALVMCFCKKKMSHAVIGNHDDKLFVALLIPKNRVDIRVRSPRSRRGRGSDPSRLLH